MKEDCNCWLFKNIFTQKVIPNFKSASGGKGILVDSNEMNPLSYFPDHFFG